MLDDTAQLDDLLNDIDSLLDWQATSRGQRSHRDVQVIWTEQFFVVVPVDSCVWTVVCFSNRQAEMKPALHRGKQSRIKISLTQAKSLAKQATWHMGYMTHVVKLSVLSSAFVLELMNWQGKLQEKQ